jgi:hypothetical protein
MTDIDITPKNNTELWKKHLKWYNLLLLKPLEEKKWDTEYYHLDQLGRDVPIEDLDEIGFDPRQVSQNSDKKTDWLTENHPGSQSGSIYVQLVSSFA